MDLWVIILLAVVQGLAELLPVSSSAHVIAAMRLLGQNPDHNELTFLLMMLHTGTMFAVIVYFWRRWKDLIWPQGRLDFHFLGMIVIATLVTGVLGFALKELIETLILERWMGREKGEVEELFKQIPLIATSLTLVGLLILAAAFTERDWNKPLTGRSAFWIGVIQGLCLPFRGFSRSGATISVGLFRGLSRRLAEEFSFALAVVLTPPLIVYSAYKLLKGRTLPSGETELMTTERALQLMTPGLIGLVFAFLAGLVALRFLSALLEDGKWAYFGFYCLGFAAFLFTGYGMGWL